MSTLFTHVAAFRENNYANQWVSKKKSGFLCARAMQDSADLIST